MPVFLVVRCSHVEGCTAEVSKLSGPAWMARIAAEQQGWHCSEFGDFCPDHIPSVNEFSSAA